MADVHWYIYLKSNSTEADSIRDFMSHIFNFEEIRLSLLITIVQSQVVSYQSVLDFPLLTNKTNLYYGKGIG
jgi:hypothetical protein